MKICYFLWVLMTMLWSFNSYSAVLSWEKLPLNSTVLVTSTNNNLQLPISNPANNKNKTFSQAWNLLINGTNPEALSFTSVPLDINKYIANSFRIEVDKTLVGDLVNGIHTGVFSLGEIFKPGIHKLIVKGGVFAKLTNTYELNIGLTAIPAPPALWLFGTATLALVRLFERKTIL